MRHDAVMSKYNPPDDVAKESAGAKPAGKADRELSALELAFVNAYCETMNATEAAARAGYKNPRVLGPRQLHKVAIKNEINRRLAVSMAKSDVTIRRLDEELERLALFDAGALFDENDQLRPVSALPPSIRACIMSIDVRVLPDGKGTIRRIRLGSAHKLPALKLLYARRAMADEATAKAKQAAVGTGFPTSPIPSEPDIDVFQRIAQLESAFLGAARREESGAVPSDGTGEPVHPAED
jgi:phage terminase small subunit